MPALSRWRLWLFGYDVDACRSWTSWKLDVVGAAVKVGVGVVGCVEITHVVAAVGFTDVVVGVEVVEVVEDVGVAGCIVVVFNVALGAVHVVGVFRLAGFGDTFGVVAVFMLLP